MKKADLLREKHPALVYRNYSYKLKGNNLKIAFSFLIEPDIRFKPELTIKNVKQSALDKIGERALNNFVFHLGLIEMLSYWKATCSPEIIIRAGYLDKEQTLFWHGLMINGLGQFFYENRIDWRKKDFLKITSNPGLDVKPLALAKINLKERYLVPVSGGKDSIVTLEKLKKKEINAFLVNPSKATKDVLKIAGIKNPVVIERKIDPNLLRLNQKGYLNGHTPFTALLSFLAVFCSALFDYKHIAFSNEKSADEGNVRYLGKIINHQYSKSSDFERKFKSYLKKYLLLNVSYSSYLRKYSEFEIAKMFTKYPKYFKAFSSCNVGQKTGERWCNQCPKCLFVYLSLYPYLKEKEMQNIFKKDLFNDKKLLPLLKSLMGQGKEKPFECVGTYQESKLALKMSFKKAEKLKHVPYLLAKIK
ncbi:MAG: hypothetical protein ABH805_00465 [Candidatus Nealsonbacteria bacterium]